MGWVDPCKKKLFSKAFDFVCTLTKMYVGAEAVIVAMYLEMHK